MKNIDSICIDLLMTTGCHLCESANREINQFNQIMQSRNFFLLVREVDISHDEDLVSRYGDKIPVLVLPQGGNALEWPFSSEDIYQFLRSDPSSNAIDPRSP